MAQKRTIEEAHANISVSSIHEKPSVLVGSFFNGFQPPKDAKIDVYKKHKGEETLFHGENSRLDYNGLPADEDNDYALAIYNPVSKSVELYKVPVVLGQVTSKAHRKLTGPAVKQNNVRYVDQKNALGEAFGTRKAKKAITDLERNRIDAEKLVHVQTDIIDTVRSGTSNLPTREQLNDKILDDRPTPAANIDATDVAEVYPIESIISEREFGQIRVEPIINELELKNKLELLPYQESALLSNKIENETRVEKLQLIYYASLLIGLYMNRRTSDKRTLATKLNDPPEILVDGLLQRFAITKAGEFGRSKDRSFKIDPHHEDKLLCYLLTVFLHIDNFTVALNPLAQELSMKQSRLAGLFKALGCNVRPINLTEAEAYGVPRAAAASYKVASLKVPFKLPVMTRRGRRT